MTALIVAVLTFIWEVAKIGIAVGAAWVAYFIYGLIKGFFIIST